jgi:hypothetical protein
VPAGVRTPSGAARAHAAEEIRVAAIRKRQPTNDLFAGGVVAAEPVADRRCSAGNRAGLSSRRNKGQPHAGISRLAHGHGQFSPHSRHVCCGDVEQGVAGTVSPSLERLVGRYLSLTE